MFYLFETFNSKLFISGVVREITRNGAGDLVPYDVREELLDKLKRMLKNQSHNSPYY